MRTLFHQTSVTTMLYALCGGAHISFEGDLSEHDFSRIQDTTVEESKTLQRITAWPKLDFIIVPLETHTVPLILELLTQSKHTWRNIVHTQIERNDRIEFGAYDNFDPDCVACGSAISRNVLEELVSKGAIHSFEPVILSSKG